MMQRGTNTVWDRMVGAALLDPAAYEAVERDTDSTVTALLIVVAAAVATGIGAFTATGISGLYRSIIADLVSWVLYATFAYFIGTRFFKTDETRATVGELLRTLGFAQVPSFFLILSGILFVGGFISIIVFFWILATTVVALRQALELTTGRAIGTAIVSWLLYVIPFLIIVALIP